ncbi:single-stranded-DNA-specific exonuclease RecJ [Glycocaulis alkaliphilus]|uniref:Single-stranded-DNA-specific exonuclease RecJ n=1 Tax=Glycocaulis alkaliphilus TaxID=1434191 RepID=A0A3T0EA54_9PROT|nr:single-stranded-DNA-specific exonuclease RecJ [Glycocaulis alkaliphilus]AZU04345.1 single-stranded-DNA-specific exonuclease RecJ [Glycocaulis alkaliphilus]GGB77677.1 single-stranded-DNA-specific exonuclease RecJ [Glycocaulis alkaliphilus]
MAGREPLFGVTASVTGRAWALSEASDEAVAAIVRATGCNDALARLMASRDISVDDAPAFLSPRLRDSFPDPSSFLGMDAAARAVWDAVEAGTRIAVFADYDVDGASSGAQLVRWLRAVGQEALTYVPDRIEEGYGPSAEAFASLKAAGAGLVVTVDCGAAAHGALESAAGMGLPVVVIDHHLMDGPPPPALALVNPNQPGDTSGCGHMAAAGVTLVFLAALNREGRARGAFKGPEPDILAMTDLAALGTVCDVVPLTGPNRAIVTQGLKVMSGWHKVGLAALAEVSGLTGPASPYHAGFLLGPRINAGGRVGVAGLGLELLGSEDPARVREIALELDRLNAERKAIEDAVLTAALDEIESGRTDAGGPVIVLAGEGWHPGVIGIAAGRIKDQFNRPTIVIGVENGVGKGSGRSCPGVHLGNAILAAREAGLLEKGGGHAMAAGLTVEEGRIAAFRDFLADRLAPEWAAADEARTLRLDGVVHPAAVDFDFGESLKQAAPFGMGNPEPRFALSDLHIRFVKEVGTGHLRFTFEADTGAQVSGIAFRALGKPLGDALTGARDRKWHVAGRIKAEDNRFGRKAELHLEDMAAAG